MTRRDYVDQLAEQTGYPKVRIAEVLGRFLDAITAELADDGRVEFRGFGSLRVVELPARTGHNPKTGEPVEIPASRHVRFKAGKRMREVLNPAD